MAETTFTSVTWTLGDIITEAKMDNMVANSQAVDAHAQGIRFDERSDPADGDVSAGEGFLYAKNDSGQTRLYLKDDSDIVHEIPIQREIQVLVFDDATDVSTGDGAGDVFIRISPLLNGMNLVDVGAQNQTAATGTGSQTTDIQIHNVTQAADMLSTKLTIDEDETDSNTAATAAVIDTANDDVATGDQIRIDVDAIPSGAPKGLTVTLTFQKS